MRFRKKKREYQGEAEKKRQTGRRMSIKSAVLWLGVRIKILRRLDENKCCSARWAFLVTALRWSTSRIPVEIFIT